MFQSQEDCVLLCLGRVLLMDMKHSVTISSLALEDFFWLWLLLEESMGSSQATVACNKFTSFLCGSTQRV